MERLNEVEQKLANLRDIVPIEWNPEAVPLFDEFVREHEWGLALHIVCDYLLEPTTPSAPQGLIEQIESLHKTMEIQDSCVTELR